MSPYYLSTEMVGRVCKKSSYTKSYDKINYEIKMTSTNWVLLSISEKQWPTETE